MTQQLDPRLLPLIELLARAAFEAARQPRTIPEPKPAQPPVTEQRPAA